MTTQIRDKLTYNSVKYSVIRQSTKCIGLFDPRTYGLIPEHVTSINHSGYTLSYNIKGNRLVIDELHIALFHRENHNKEIVFLPYKGQPINGVDSELISSKEEIFSNSYQGLNLFVKFTGGLLIANQYVEKKTIAEEFHPVFMFQTLIEIIFENGFLLKVQEVSKQVKEMREHLIQSTNFSDWESIRKEVDTWIPSLFNLNYYSQ